MVPLDHTTLSQRLARARTPDQVLTAIRGFLFMVPPEDIESLPGECAELCVQDAASLRHWADVFTEAAASGPAHARLCALQQALALAASRHEALASRPSYADRVA